jgi:hypothetical protein
MKVRELFAAFVLPQLVLGLVVAFTLGCDNKETVLDVETPGGEVEVERDRDTGDVDVDATDNDDKLIDINTPGADVEVDREDDGDGIDVDVNTQ